MIRRYVALFVLIAAPLCAQAPVTQPAAAPAPPPPPATKLEAFKPAAGTASVMAFTTVGKVQEIEVDAREVRDSKNVTVRGLVVAVTQNQYRAERAFVDVEEIPELLRGIDQILAVKENPSPGFKDFEVRYTTKGELRCVAFSYAGKVRYSVEAGRVLRATRLIDEGEMREFRNLIANAMAVLTAAPAK